MKLIVITGCLGLIGNYVTTKCLEQGWKVYGIDKQTYAANNWALKEFNKNPNFTFRKEDIVKLDNLPDCDYVINLAAESHVGNSIIDSNQFIETNINGVKNLLDILRFKQENVFNRPVLIHFSTDEVYGDIEEGQHTELDLLKPSNPYSASKAAADMLILAWARTYGLKHIIVRPTNNYGIGQYPEKLIPISVKCLMMDKKIRLHNKGTPIRTWLHAEDTANAIITIINSKVTNEIYNVSGGFEQSNSETVRKIIESYLKFKEIDFSNYVDLSYVRQGQDIRYSLDDTKIRKLGWSPKKDFDSEIKKIVEYYKTNFIW